MTRVKRTYNRGGYRNDTGRVVEEVPPKAVIVPAKVDPEFLARQLSFLDRPAMEAKLDELKKNDPDYAELVLRAMVKIEAESAKAKQDSRFPSIPESEEETVVDTPNRPVEADELLPVDGEEETQDSETPKAVDDIKPDDEEVSTRSKLLKEEPVEEMINRLSGLDPQVREEELLILRGVDAEKYNVVLDGVLNNKQGGSVEYPLDNKLDEVAEESEEDGPSSEE